MKKLLALLSITGIVATSGANVIACNDTNGGFKLPTNPTNQEELLKMLEDNKTLKEENDKSYEEINNGDLKDIVAKIGSESSLDALSEDEIKTLKNSEAFNTMFVKVDFFTAISYKVAQFLVTLEKEKEDEFLTTNKELISKFEMVEGQIQSMKPSVGEEQLKELSKAILAMRPKAALTDESYKIMQDTWKWVLENKFVKAETETESAT